MPISYLSRTNAFTTRIPLTFSCTLSLRASYFLNSLLNRGIAFEVMMTMPMTSMGSTSRYTTESEGAIMLAIVRANISMKGLRTAMRIIIMKAFWILVTSVVSLVTSDEVENLSIFANEKSCTL